MITNRTIIDEVNEGLAESTITFFDLELSDDADYHCQASNPGAHDTVFNVSSNQSHLTVRCRHVVIVILMMFPLFHFRSTKCHCIRAIGNHHKPNSRSCFHLPGLWYTYP